MMNYCLEFAKINGGATQVEYGGYAKVLLLKTITVVQPDWELQQWTLRTIKEKKVNCCQPNDSIILATAVNQTYEGDFGNLFISKIQEIEGGKIYCTT